MQTSYQYNIGIQINTMAATSRPSKAHLTIGQCSECSSAQSSAPKRATLTAFPFIRLPTNFYVTI